jgi:hypothetical protein
MEFYTSGDGLDIMHSNAWLRYRLVQHIVDNQKLQAQVQVKHAEIFESP